MCWNHFNLFRWPKQFQLHQMPNRAFGIVSDCSVQFVIVYKRVEFHKFANLNSTTVIIIKLWAWTIWKHLNSYKWDYRSYWDDLSHQINAIKEVHLNRWATGSVKSIHTDVSCVFDAIRLFTIGVSDALCLGRESIGRSTDRQIRTYNTL